MVQMKSKGSPLENSILLGRLLFFVLVSRPSADWTRLTHTMASNLFYSKFIDLNVNLIQKHFLVDT